MVFVAQVLVVDIPYLHVLFQQQIVEIAQREEHMLLLVWAVFAETPQQLMVVILQHPFVAQEIVFNALKIHTVRLQLLRAAEMS